jgi:hypothetical protein
MNALPENLSPWSWSDPEKMLRPVGDFSSIWSSEVLRAYRDELVANAAASMAAAMDKSILEAAENGKNLDRSVGVNDTFSG